MTEGIRKRMSSIVGDENTVGRYLLEKIGHTALIAWAIVQLTDTRAVHAAVIAAVGYVLIGKVIWFVQHRTFDFWDFLFDIIVGYFVVVLCYPNERGWWWFVAGLVGWMIAIAVGSNNQYGKPS